MSLRCGLYIQAGGESMWAHWMPREAGVARLAPRRFEAASRRQAPPREIFQSDSGYL